MPKVLATVNRTALFACAVVLLVFLGVSGLWPAQVHAAATPYAASAVLGQPDFSSDTSGTTDSTLDSPWGATALDAARHRLFVADTENNRVLVFNLDNSNNVASKAAAYVLGQSTFSTNTSGNDANELDSPTGLAFDPVNNRLFVASDDRVSVFELANGITSGMNAIYSLGQPGGFGTSTVCAVAPDSLCGTTGGIAFDKVHQRLFVPDGNAGRIMVFDVSPDTIATAEDASYVLGQPNLTTAPRTTTGRNSFDYIEYNGLAYNNTTQMFFLADPSGNRVLVFDLSQGITDGMDAAYVLGQPSFTDDSSGLTQHSFDYATGLGVDEASNRLFVGDTPNNCRVLVFDLAGGITNDMDASGVVGQTDFTTNDCATTSQTQMGSSGWAMNMAFDPGNGRLYMTHYGDNRVLIYNFAHVSTSSLPDGVINTAYNQQLAAVNQQGTATFSLVGGSLPPGLGLDASTGVISGTATQAGTYTFEITIADDNGTLGVFTEDPPVTITIQNPAAPSTGMGAVAPRTPAAAVLVAGIAAAAVGLALLRRHGLHESN